MRYKGRDDMLVMQFAAGTTVAGVFTRSSMPGAPVEWCRKILPGGSARALVVNAGIATVFTGKAGQQAEKATAAGTATAPGGQANEATGRAPVREEGVADGYYPGEPRHLKNK